MTTQEEQAFAEAQATLTNMVNAVRASRGRKAERHGEKFDEALAIKDTAKGFKNVNTHALANCLAAALHRLAVLPDVDDFVFPALTDLDFDPDPAFDPEKPVDGD